jgi:hypothetical protein
MRHALKLPLKSWKVGYFRAQGNKRQAFKVTGAGFDYFDQITKDLCSADHQEFENLLKVINTDPRAAKKRRWELVAKTMYRCAGKEPSHLDPNSPELEEVIGYLRKSARFSERLVREIEDLRNSCRTLFTQSEFAGGPIEGRSNTICSPQYCGRERLIVGLRGILVDIAATA